MDTKHCIRCKGEIAEHYSTCPLCGSDPHEVKWEVWDDVFSFDEWEDRDELAGWWDPEGWSPKYIPLGALILLFFVWLILRDHDVLGFLSRQFH